MRNNSDNQHTYITGYSTTKITMTTDSYDLHRIGLNGLVKTVTVKNLPQVMKFSKWIFEEFDHT